MLPESRLPLSAAGDDSTRHSAAHNANSPNSTQWLSHIRTNRLHPAGIFPCPETAGFDTPHLIHHP
ncbi:MAG: hypothetical protein IJ680_03835 [Paludibacteraceae bacterium]|nr:hypothetical protein [Paludibacteraceae bacterium]